MSLVGEGRGFLKGKKKRSKRNRKEMGPAIEPSKKSLTTGAPMPCESQEPSGPGPKTRPAVEVEDEGRSAPSSAAEAAAQTLPPPTTTTLAAVRLAGGASERRERGTHARGVAGGERAAAPGAGIATLLDAAATRKDRERFIFDRVWLVLSNVVASHTAPLSFFVFVEFVPRRRRRRETTPLSLSPSRASFLSARPRLRSPRSCLQALQRHLPTPLARRVRAFFLSIRGERGALRSPGVGKEASKRGKNLGVDLHPSPSPLPSLSPLLIPS